MRMPVRRKTTDRRGLIALACGKIQGGSSDQRRSFPRIKVLQLAPELQKSRMALRRRGLAGLSVAAGCQISARIPAGIELELFLLPTGVLLLFRNRWR